MRARSSWPTACATPPWCPPRLTRSESFLGVHFDFHAGPDCQEVGKRTTRESIERLLEAVRPDYVQIDCKGHPGFSSYPTRVGTQAPGFVGDPLRLWREATAEKGTRDGRMTSVFGPYVDELHRHDGGFQRYFPQRRDGSVREWQYPIMADVARFCRESIRWPPPASVLLQPGGRSVVHEFRDDRLHITVPRVEIHDIIEIQPGVEPQWSR